MLYESIENNNRIPKPQISRLDKLITSKKNLDQCVYSPHPDYKRGCTNTHSIVTSGACYYRCAKYVISLPTAWSRIVRALLIV